MIVTHIHTYEKWQINVTRTNSLLVLHTTDIAMLATITMNFHDILA